MIKRDTCRYAKRQMTWFAAEREIVWLSPEDVDTAAERIGLFLQSAVNLPAGEDLARAIRSFFSGREEAFRRERENS